MFTSKPPTCAGRTLALPRKDRDIRYLRPFGNSDIAGKRAAFSKVRWARSVRPRRRQLPQGPSVCDKIAASSDCSRPVNDYVHIEAADLRRPNARFTTERQGYQVLTPFGKLGYSRFFCRQARKTWPMRAGTSADSALQSGSARTTAAMVSVTSSPANVFLPVSIS